MASTPREEAPEEGVELVHEVDGRITARDKETGGASYGHTEAEALGTLAEALELHEEVVNRSPTTTSASWASTPTRRATRNCPNSCSSGR